MPKLSDFIKKYTGVKNVGNTDANRGECVGLVMLWVAELKLSHVWGHARDIFANASTKEYKKIKNAKDLYPVEGDIICWDATTGGGYGHIAVVVSSDPKNDTFTVFEQNNPLDNPPRTFTYKNWNGVIGWLHPLVLDVVAETPEDKVSVLEKKLADMTKLKDEWKERARTAEATIKEKDEQYEKAKQLIELVEEKKNEAVLSANKYSQELLTTKDNLKHALELNLSLVEENKLLKENNKKDYTFNEIVQICKDYIYKLYEQIKKS